MTLVLTAIGILVAATVPTFGYMYVQRHRHRERLAHSFANAVLAISQYKSLPFRVRRRAGADAETRTVLANLATTTHEALDFHLALITLEVPSVAPSYTNLVSVARREIGDHVKRAWDAEPVSTDKGMNLGLGEQYPMPETERATEVCLEAMRRELSRSW